MAGKQAGKKKSPPKSEQLNPFAALAGMVPQPRKLTPEEVEVRKHNSTQNNRFLNSLGLMQSGSSAFDTPEKALAAVDKLAELTPMKEWPKVDEQLEFPEQAQA